MFVLLRMTRAVCGVIAIVEIPAVLHLSATHFTQAERGGQVIALFVFGILFFALRGFINRLHLKKHGVPHPSLKHDFSL
jgi:hypothetical protein